jgi:hypothetical protein
MRRDSSTTLVLVTLLAGCVTEVASIRDETNAVLGGAEGYLLMQVDTTHNLKAIHIAGAKNIMLTSADLRAGSNYILINLPAGNYEIDKVDLNRFVYYKLDNDMWDFSVRENVISYVGNLTFKGSTWGTSGHFLLINRSSFALEYLEDNYPTLLASKRMEFRGPGADDFFDVITSN